MLELKLLALLLTANGSPVVARMLLGHRFTVPLDGGRHWRDGRPLLGPSKTLAGVVVAVSSTALVALPLGLPVVAGVLIGAGSMLGDALSSFVKRRLGMASGARAIGLDQIPEALVALLLAQPLLALPWMLIILLPVAFMLADLLISRALFWLGFHQHPH